MEIQMTKLQEQFHNAKQDEVLFGGAAPAAENRMGNY